MTPILITPPAVEPVSLADAREWLRLVETNEDDLVAALIAGARGIVEAATRRRLVTQTWRIVHDRWPGPGDRRGGLRSSPTTVAIPMAPLQSVAAIRVIGAGGAAQTLAASSYALAGAPEEARIVFNIAPPDPGAPAAGIEIDVVCGYGDAATSVPEPLRLAMKMLVARWFENRGDVETDTSVDRLPGPIAALIAPFRRARLA
jgi:uncharacterized phiE125 gp8 family phage protein